MWNLIKKYWNVWGSVIVSWIIAWYFDFSKSSMDKTTSFLSMFLVVFAIFTVIKTTYLKEYKKGLLEKGVTGQKQLKVMEQAINPLKQGEDIVKLGIETTKELKKMSKFWKKVCTNFSKFKGISASVILCIYGILSEYYGLFQAMFHANDKVAEIFNWTIIGLSVLTGIISYPQSSEEHKVMIASLKEWKEKKGTSKESILENQLKLKTKELKTKNGELDELTTKQNELTKTIENAKVEYSNTVSLSAQGILPSEDVIKAKTEYDNKVAELEALNKEINECNIAINLLTGNINTINMALSNLD